ncbi:MAG: P-loop NTPase fold protein [Filifactor alocis]|nr:P-loop NTPase fold protein [Filifactor alocis]
MAIKSFELAPTKENIMDTLKEDLLGRNKSVYRFVQFCNAQENHCAIALDARWGHGKTFFVKQVKTVLEAYNPLSEGFTDEEKTEIKQMFTDRGLDNIQPSLCVYYDAWSNDNDIDPILSLIYEILKDTVQGYKQFKEVDIAGIATSIIDFFTGKDLSNLVELSKGENILSALKEQKDIHQRIAEFLDSLLAERGDRLVIFVDELDRCKPSYAVQLLERIKHYFFNERITFVFSIHTGELMHTIKQYYGSDFDSCRYLDRFFDYRMDLPLADMTKYYQKLGFDEMHWFDKVCRLFAEKYNFGLREVDRYQRMTKIAAYSVTHSNSCWGSGFSDHRGLMFGLITLVPVMIGLRMVDVRLYDEFVGGKNSSPLIELLCDNRRKLDPLLSMLLNPSETFDPEVADTIDGSGRNKRLVSLEDRLGQVYNALFNNHGRRGYDEIEVGECAFSRSMKNELIEVSSMLSEFTSYDI